MDYFSEIQTGSEGMPDANGNGNVMVNKVNSVTGETPIFHAVQSGSKPMVRLLMFYGMTEKKVILIIYG